VERVHELRFDAASFDLVIASSVLHHVPPDQLQNAFAEIARVLEEHVRLVGREPSSAHAVASTGPWLAGAIMNSGISSLGSRERGSRRTSSSESTTTCPTSRASSRRSGR
jgi:ubiquinone/menaquinone biosynthesis C-methylase UbiE